MQQVHTTVHRVYKRYLFVWSGIYNGIYFSYIINNNTAKLMDTITNT